MINNKSIRRKVLIMIVLTAVICGGCRDAHKEKSTSVEVVYETQPQETPTAVSISVTEEPISNTEVYITEEAIVEFRKTLADIDIAFAYEECFGIETMEALLEERLPVHKESEYGMIVDSKVDVEALYTSVVSQSEMFREESAHYMYTLIENKAELMQILTYVAEAVDLYCESAEAANIGELDCILRNLKVYYRSGTTNAAFTDENCLLVNPNMIQMMEVISENEESFRNILYHETQHMFQSDCPCRKAQEYEQTGFCRRMQEASVSPYYWLWTLEGCAEKRVVNMTGDAPITYKYLQGYVETMDYVALPHPNSAGITDVEDASVSRDMLHLYTIMGWDQGIRHEEITQMMYAMEVAQNKTQDYRTVVEEALGVALTDEEYTALRNQLKVQYCEMLTKIFYNNLALAISEGHVSLEDIFTLVHVYEGDMNYHLEYGKNPEGVNASFLQTYGTVQEEFFALLATGCGMDIEDLYERFREHAVLHRAESGILQCNATFAWLSEEERLYVFHRAVSDTVEYIAK